MWELTPGERVELGGTVSVNSGGFRDRERGEKTGARFLALGDSSIYGFGVHDAQVFTAVLERSLERVSPGTEVINAGVPGYSTEQALNRLLHDGLDLDPDVLLVGTLWSDNNFDRFVDGDLIVRYGGWSDRPEARLRRVLEWSGIFRWLDYSLRSRGPEGAMTVGWMTDPDGAAGRRRVPIDDYARNLARFCAIMADRDGGVVFIQLANVEDVHPTVEDPPWAPYREVMRRTAEACGAPLVSVPQAYAAAGGSSRDLFLDEMHPSSRGHAVLAEAVSGALRTAGWPDIPLRVQAPAAPVLDVDDPFEGRGLELGLVEDEALGPAGPPPGQGGPGAPGVHGRSLEARRDLQGAAHRVGSAGRRDGDPSAAQDRRRAPRVALGHPPPVPAQAGERGPSPVSEGGGRRERLALTRPRLAPTRAPPPGRIRYSAGDHRGARTMVLLLVATLGCTTGDLHVPEWTLGANSDAAGDDGSGGGGASGGNGGGGGGDDSDDWDGTTSVANVYDSTDIPCETGDVDDPQDFIVDNRTDQGIRVTLVDDDCVRVDPTDVTAGAATPITGHFGGAYVLTKVEEGLDVKWLRLGDDQPTVAVE